MSGRKLITCLLAVLTLVPLLAAPSSLAQANRAQDNRRAAAFGIEVRQGRKAMPGVEVRLESEGPVRGTSPEPQVTDGEGRAEFWWLTPGIWRVDLLMDGEVAYFLTVRIDPGRRAEEMGSPARDVDAPDLRWKFFRPQGEPPPPPPPPSRTEPQPQPEPEPEPEPAAPEAAPEEPEAEVMPPTATDTDLPAGAAAAQGEERPPAEPMAEPDAEPAPEADPAQPEAAQAEPAQPEAVEPRPAPEPIKPVTPESEVEEPEAPEAATSEPGVEEPEVEEIGLEETETAEPATSEPVTPEPTVEEAEESEPASPQPATPAAALEEPEEREAATSELAAPEPAQSEPGGELPAESVTPPPMIPDPTPPPTDDPTDEEPELAVEPEEAPPAPALNPPPPMIPEPATTPSEDAAGEEPAVEEPPAPAPVPEPVPAETVDGASEDLPVPPDAQPDPVAAAPVEPAPAAGPRFTSGSGAGGDCPECKASESSVTLERTVPPGDPGGGATCGPDMASSALAAARRLAARGQGLGPGMPLDGGEISRYTASGASCQVMGVVLPPGVRYRGYTYSVEAGGGAGGPCYLPRACPVAGAIWTDRPVIEELENGARMVYGVFRNASAVPLRAKLQLFYVEE